MKKSIKILALCMAGLSLTTMVACKQRVEGSVADDPNIPNVYFYYYDGDGEKNWVIDSAKEFNKTINNYEIIPYGTLNEDTAQNLISGGGNASIIQMTHSNIESLINSGAVADLSDILERDVDGVKVKDKMRYLEETKAMYSTNLKDGLYALLSGITCMHLFFDYNLFYSKGWLIYQKEANGAPKRDADGNILLSVGHDGVAGTYDDGQPVTIEEWDEMMSRIMAAPNTKPFIYTTKYNFYLEPLLHSLIATYGGIDEYRSVFMGYGSYVDSDGKTVNVELQNGYELFKAPSVSKAMEFFAKYFCGQDYLHEKAKTSTSLSHKEAVNYFISGFMEEVQQAAMLVEMPTFEISNKAYFDMLSDAGNTDYGYGKREFRIMLLPKFNPKNDVSYVTSQGGAAIVVSSDTNSERLQVAKDFMVYLMKDKWLQQYTIDTGAVRPYNYSLTEEQKNSLTPTQRVAIETLLDTENVKILTPLDYAVDAPWRLGLMDKYPYYDFTASMPDGTYERPLMVLRRYSASEYVEGIYNYRKSHWPALFKTA